MNHDSDNNSPSPETSSYAKMQAESLPKDTDTQTSQDGQTSENLSEKTDTSPKDDTTLKSQQALKDAQAAFEKEKKELLLRHLAEQKNLIDRHQRETSKARDYAIQGFAQDLLSIADALYQGIESADPENKKGLQLILNVFNQTLAKHNITPLDPQGEAYDPHFHEAMVMQPNPDVENNHIIQVIQIGYKLKDRLLRPARVIVAQNA